jgi:tetratricopeptide (TPR) repeat protein
MLLKNVAEAKDDPKEALWELGRFYASRKQHEKALDCLRQIMARLPDAERKAACVLAMGQTMEQVQDYESAIGYYREALALEPVRTPTWFFLHNNLGFSLNTLGKYEEGEVYCRRAIEIDPTRPNGHKNLGMALAGQGNFREAAQCFVTATRVDASDRRSFDLLTKLLAEHPELEFEFGVEVECCRQAVGVAAGEMEKLKPVVHRGFRKRLFLLRLRLRAFAEGLRKFAGMKGTGDTK